MKLLNATLGVLMVGLVSMPVFAGTGGNNECPVGQVNGLSLDDEFGPGSQELTQCLKKRHDVKMVVQIFQFCANGAATCTSPYALGNISNILDDYEITHGMLAGRDYKVVAVLHGSGGKMALKSNPFAGKVKELMARGVKFYFCQNTTRGFIRTGILPDYLSTGVSATEQLIDGMLYTTAGLTSIADFQAQGYQYIQP